MEFTKYWILACGLNTSSTAKRFKLTNKNKDNRMCEWAVVTSTRISSVLKRPFCFSQVRCFFFYFLLFFSIIITLRPCCVSQPRVFILSVVGFLFNLQGNILSKTSKERFATDAPSGQNKPDECNTAHEIIIWINTGFNLMNGKLSIYTFICLRRLSWRL